MPFFRVLPLDVIDGPALELRADVDQSALYELAESIRSVGLLEPVGVAADGDRYRLVYGRRRFLALRWLGRTDVPAMVLSTDEAHETEASLAENVVRRDLSPVEEARALRHMIDVGGRSVPQVAAAAGKSAAWVRSRLELLHFPADIIEHLARGDLSVAVAHELVLVEDDRMRAVYVRHAVENGVTASTARLWRQEWEAAHAGGTEPPAEPGGGAAPAPPPVPLVACQVCGDVQPITVVAFVRACPTCQVALAEAKRSA